MGPGQPLVLGPGACLHPWGKVGLVPESCSYGLSCPTPQSTSRPSLHIQDRIILITHAFEGICAGPFLTWGSPASLTSDASTFQYRKIEYGDILPMCVGCPGAEEAAQV